MRNQVQKWLSVLCVLALILACAPLGAQAEAVPTPGPEKLGKLQIRIEGPDPRMPMIISYEEFTDGEYELTGLVPGVYTITEVDPEKLLEDEYTYDEAGSIRKLTIEVKDGEDLSGTLVNKYERGTPVPSVTPTPDEPTPTPEPTEEPTPEPEPETVEIPVRKQWVDNNDRDGNRPASVKVHLLADGTSIQTVTLKEDNGWAWTFRDLPKKDENGREIVYTVAEEKVEMYEVSVDGYTITNKYVPETTTVTVAKVWNDNGDAAKMRPLSIYCFLNNGMAVKLSAENGWTATITGLPTIVNGRKVTYTWTEQEVLGYKLTDEKTTGSVTVFTNDYEDVPPPPPDKTPPPRRGTPITIIDEYDTPLGIEIIINHVGDCFD